MPWQHDEIQLYGKRIVTARRVAWYGDEAFDYRYSGVNHRARLWAPPLRTLRDQVSARVGVSFNSCLLNRYDDGTQGMAWHSDDEAELGPETVIASVSFGATRKFAFRHRQTRQKVEMLLHHGQLIVMRGQTQAHWQHDVPDDPDARVRRLLAVPKPSSPSRISVQPLPPSQPGCTRT